MSTAPPSRHAAGPPVAGAIQSPAESALPHYRSRPEDQIARQSVPRRGQPEDVAAIAFLAHPNASFITAQSLTIDGGWMPHRLTMTTWERPVKERVGGGVEPEDADLEAAPLREVHEEIAGVAVNLHPFRQLDPRLPPRPGWPALGGHGFLRSNPRRHPSPVT
ncbi:SDR family oxidoreductase [Streptomyces sp. H036]|uniref:SDR family oxidoreductase n=1 Tax=Streptomyces sp. H036 TaxID=1519487 RepID=UPI002D21C7FE|nr:SDR family oxidoreductase [Streptomyces sp. H036]